MHLKTHLAIIASIVVILFLAKGVISSFFIPENNNIAEPKPVKSTSPYFITIAHASFGLNCLEYMKYIQQNSRYSGNYYQPPEMNEFKNIKEDNVLFDVSNICNGKATCTIDSSSFTDPAPSCPNKEVEIGYRCFSIDKLRTAKSISGQPVTIDCDKEMEGDTTIRIITPSSKNEENK